jgi:hypothetical protein
LPGALTVLEIEFWDGQMSVALKERQVAEKEAKALG